ncbi:hypothetical protein ACRALDRAFT_205787 [Sodiomyces alcalophilus JCM 7366]|uniref:uncharacterized protein n=1 Tax=Sodiomyces alcalophilus JCM 7366 TaxID=591952 RepID=UPI0039B3AB01
MFLLSGVSCGDRFARDCQTSKAGDGCEQLEGAQPSLLSINPSACRVDQSINPYPSIDLQIT